MGERMGDTLSADARKAFLASKNQADAARVVGMDGKAFRNVTRNVFGVYVSRDDAGAWDERTRAFRLAYHISTGDARKAVVAAFKNGDAAPPKP
jgi:hypothetical protein